MLRAKTLSGLQCEAWKTGVAEQFNSECYELENVRFSLEVILFGFVQWGVNENLAGLATPETLQKQCELFLMLKKHN